MGFAQSGAPTELRHGGRRMRLEWHELRRCADDPPFARRNLRIGLKVGASLEVDIQRLACGRFVCLHDPLLQSETTGEGPVAESEAAAVVRLRMRDAPEETPLLLDDLAEIVRRADAAPSARIQLDLKATADHVDRAARMALAAALEGIADLFILSGDDWSAVTGLGTAVRGLVLGYNPSEHAGEIDLVRLVSEVAPEADTIYLHRRLVRRSVARGDDLVGRLRAHGHRVDSWTIDHGAPEAIGDLTAALGAGCDQITTNTATAWAAWKPASRPDSAAFAGTLE